MQCKYCDNVMHQSKLSLGRYIFRCAVCGGAFIQGIQVKDDRWFTPLATIPERKNEYGKR
jgi:hypothetical protein